MRASVKYQGLVCVSIRDSSRRGVGNTATILTRSKVAWLNCTSLGGMLPRTITKAATMGLCSNVLVIRKQWALWAEAEEAQQKKIKERKEKLLTTREFLIGRARKTGKAALVLRSWKSQNALRAKPASTGFKAETAITQSLNSRG